MNSELIQPDGLHVAFSALREDTAPLWGKMNARQMVEHVAVLFSMSNGTIQAVCPFKPETLAKLLPSLTGPDPFPRHVYFKGIQPEEPLPPAGNSLSESLDILLREAKLYHTYWEQNPAASRVHPVFGPLGKELWDRAHTKHVSHHLRQFGLLS